MHDGLTRKVDTPESPHSGASFLAGHRVTLTLENGPEAGTEWALEGARTIVGRSAKAGIQLDDPSVSSEHAALELTESGFGIRDLASTNGVDVCGKRVLSTALQHGDLIQLGDCQLRYIVEEKTRAPKVWSVEEEDA